MWLRYLPCNNIPMICIEEFLNINELTIALKVEASARTECGIHDFFLVKLSSLFISIHQTPTVYHYSISCDMGAKVSLGTFKNI